jgi:hypothetical protein
MSRKNWSNFFIFVGVLNLAVSVLPTNPMKIANWIAIPCCLAVGTLARRRMIPMIPKNAFPAVTAMGKQAHEV